MNEQQLRSRWEKELGKRHRAWDPEFSNYIWQELKEEGAVL
jgi:hypothetical protein